MMRRLAHFLEIVVVVVQNVMSDIRTQQAKSFDTIQWQGEYVPIHNEKVRLSILRGNELTSQLDSQEDPEKRMDLFIEVFSSYDEALVFVRNDLQNEVSCSCVAVWWAGVCRC